MAQDKYTPIKKLIQQGRIDEARARLAQAVKEDPQDAQAWYGLAQVVDDPAKKKYCLERANRLAPGEPAATTAQLARLSLRNPGPQSPTAPSPLASIPDLPPPSKPTWKAPKKDSSPAWLGWLVVALTVVLVPCLCIAVSSYMIQDTFHDINSAILGAPVIPSGASSGASGVTHQVVYRVEGSAASAMISYNNQHGDTDVIESTKLPWSKRITRKDTDFATLVAQPGNAGGSVTCIIEVDGHVWKRSTNQGVRGLAICGGWIGAE